MESSSQPKPPARVSTNVRIRRDMVERLDHEARVRLLSRNYLIEAAVELLIAADFRTELPR